MSSLRVLLVGDNPNIVLFASRFQLANSVELFHVGKSPSNSFQVDTDSYGSEKFQLQNHFTSLQELVDECTRTDRAGIAMDLVVLSASSLQELSNTASELEPLTNSNTKIFLESSGSIQLEPFVKQFIKESNVLSVVSDFDIRETATNTFKQFGAKQGDHPNKMYLGVSTMISLATYPQNIVNLLNTFQKLFSKLFPEQVIDLCSYHPIEYLSKQWEVAIPRLCFDPLLIILEETHPAGLDQQILAKPLISGLVAEALKIAASMGVKLGPSWDNEASLLKKWAQHNADEVPSLLYHFIHRTASLNIDLLWLQVILLADDYNIKTPYMEFLYSMITQLQNINQGASKWFVRIEDHNGQATAEHTDNLNRKIQELSNTLVAKDNQLDTLNNNVTELQKQLQSNQRETAETVKNYQTQINTLNEKLKTLTVATSVHDTAVSNTNVDNYKPTGTPNLNDLEDVALFGVNYGESPLKNNLKAHGSEINGTSSNGSATSQNLNANSSDSNNSQIDDMDKSMQEKELELKRRELELQERELELQRRALQNQFQQQQQPYPQPRHPKMPPMNGNSATPPPSSQQQQQQQMGGRKSSYNQIYQQPYAPNMRGNRNMHGATSAPSSSSNNLIDPMSSSMPYNNGFQGSQQQQSQQMAPYNSASQQYPIKPTSRKNRSSNMPNFRNPSTSNLGNFGMPGGNGAMGNGIAGSIPPSLNSQSRLNSLSSQSMPLANRIRQRQPQQSSSFNNLHAASRNNPGIPSNQNFAQQQRQLSSNSASDIHQMANMSTNTVVHNDLAADRFTPTGQNNDSATVTTRPEARQPIQFGTPPIPQAPSNDITSSPASMETTDTKTEEKKKKKKFGLFKKKIRSR
ncbi:Svl3p KNAG_0A02280 [Huiozyma naganishii CBS 8797]|uniref:Ketopantoate reductase C-terminal domain-containing protein n=1 Tax=Huiozyma naganishii (strain ATCC MYA-139 / BCRC 22969 / CBS 8797 / KCTC 17520 / NBRC 10181 / NCYC 3082 / Yp74L-3) TaxID=1071383 RepID=J7RT78_HUIN7|nr:hypothetical protein KNAG_0A02280 [Kazachstania naganishii CBS 8797]CCK67917.1 hypothetical protein KNAG_0A02280 [Kazachstania naganishii CBS 8797]